jgi:transglutaminase-like putative cysteine protease
MTEPIRPTGRLSLAAALTTFTSVLGLARLVQPKLWLLECVLLIAVVIGSGHLARVALRGRSGALAPVVILIQLICGSLVCTLLTVHGSAPFGFFPGPGALRALSSLLNAGGNAIASAVPPAQPVPGLVAILLLVCLGLALLIDALAVSFHRAVLVGLPVLATVLVPSTRLPGGLSWLAFSIAVIGYLTLLNAEGQVKLQRWGQLAAAPIRQGAGDKPDVRGSTGTHQPLAARITMTSLVVALILPVFIPTFPGLLHEGSGGGGGADGNYSLSTDVDLRDSLSNSDEIPLLAYSTSAPAADVANEYLGMSVLDYFDGNRWSASGTKASTTGIADSAKGVPGLTLPGVKQNPIVTKVTVVGNFAFSTIPTPYATNKISGIANTRSDPNTLGYSIDGLTDSQLGLQYQSTSTEVVPTIAEMQDSPAVGPAETAQFLELPADLPAQVDAVAEQVTAGDTTPYSKAVALQNYFLKNFTYSLSVPVGDSNSAIVNFLDDKIGFCQQFSATMATMARLLGIPAVVEVGFTPGARQANGTYLVTSHDAHAWPMLYFSGIGWVRFEPTPGIAASGRGSEPAWAPPPTTGTQASPTTSANAGSSSTAKSEPNKCGTALRGRGITSCANGQSGAAAAAPFAALGPLGAVPREFDRLFLSGPGALIALKLILLILLIAYCFPAYARISRRIKRRVLVRKLNRLLARAAQGGRDGSGYGPDGSADRDADGDPGGTRDSRNRSLFAQATEAVWAELRENAGDLGYSWDESDTPRQATTRLSREADLDEPANAAARRITMLAEHAWYAPLTVPEPGQLQGLSTDLDLVRTGLAANADRSRRLRAALLPASSLAKLRMRRDRITGAVYRLLHRRGKGKP